MMLIISSQKLICDLHTFFAEVTNPNLLSGFNWIESLIYSEYKSLCQIYDLWMFPLSLACCSVILTVLWESKISMLMKSNYLSFIINTSCVVFKDSVTNSRLLRVSPVLSSRNFVVLFLTFRSIINFKLIFHT